MIEARAARSVVDVGGERGIVAGIATSGEALIWSHPDGFVICGLCLVPLDPGAYDVLTESLGEYRTSEGLFTGRLWVGRKGTFRSKATTGSKRVKARATKATGMPAPAKQAAAPKTETTESYEYRRTRMLPGGGTSVLFVRAAKGSKEFVLVVLKGRTLSTESGKWGEEGTWSEEDAAVVVDEDEDRRGLRAGAAAQTEALQARLDHHPRHGRRRQRTPSRAHHGSRTTQRNPRWHVEVSMGCAMRAAGR